MKYSKTRETCVALAITSEADAVSAVVMTAFKLHFSAWQKAYADMCAALEQMDAETAGKMRGAISAQLKGWLEKST